MVQQARKTGIKPAARLFGCSPNTVRKWMGRFDGTLASLQERSRAPARRPRKLSAEAEEEIVRARKRLPTWGARRLKRDMDLPYSVNAIRRVLKERGLVRPWRRKKHQVKRCLRQIKVAWPLWRQITVDTKHLNDLPEYWVQMRSKGLPRYQYTAREVTTGALFLGYADELSVTYAQLFAKRIAEHLAACGVEMKHVTWQSDNGSEFVGSWHAVTKSAFTKTIESYGSTHRTIPPGQHRYQADVETVHSLMETEFHLEPFKNRREFIEKAATYQHFFNYVRPNSGKEDKCPWQLIREKDSTATLNLLYLHPVFLEDLLHQRLHPSHGVHDVWDRP
jgi:transposase